MWPANKKGADPKVSAPVVGLKKKSCGRLCGPVLCLQPYFFAGASLAASVALTTLSSAVVLTN